MASPNYDVITSVHSETEQRFSRNGSLPVWYLQHASSWIHDTSGVAYMIRAAARYADKYAYKYPGSVLAHDYVVGAAWADGLRAVLDLLNGELYGLDGGTCDAIIRRMFVFNGFNDEGRAS